MKNTLCPIVSYSKPNLLSLPKTLKYLSPKSANEIKKRLAVSSQVKLVSDGLRLRKENATNHSPQISPFLFLFIYEIAFRACCPMNYLQSVMAGAALMLALGTPE